MIYAVAFVLFGTPFLYMYQVPNADMTFFVNSIYHYFIGVELSQPEQQAYVYGVYITWMISVLFYDIMYKAMYPVISFLLTPVLEKIKTTIQSKLYKSS